MAYFVSAEIDKLKKLQAAKPKEKDLEEIPRPVNVTSASLQEAMGLTENKKLYSFCRVSLLSLSFTVKVDDFYSRLFEMSFRVQVYQSMSAGEIKML